MTFPTIPTTGNGRILVQNQANATGTRTFPSLTGLTKNAGDLLVAIVVTHQATVAGATFSGWTGGFTERADLGTTSTMAVGVATKTSTGSETGTFAVTQAATVIGHCTLFVMAIEGWDGTTVLEFTALATGTTAVANPAALDPSGWDAEDTLWIAVGGVGETSTTGAFTGIGNGTYTAPASYGDAVGPGAISQDIATSPNFGVEAAVAFRQNNTASEDVAAWGGVDVSSARNCALLIAVRPAAPVSQDITPGATTVDATAGTLVVAQPQPVIPGAVTVSASTGTLALGLNITPTAVTVTATGTILAPIRDIPLTPILDLVDGGDTSTPPTDLVDAGSSSTPPADITYGYDWTLIWAEPGTVSVAQVISITPAVTTVTAINGTLSVTVGPVAIIPAATPVTASTGSLSVAPGAVSIIPTATTVTASPGSLLVNVEGGPQAITPTAVTVTATGTTDITPGPVNVTAVGPTVTASTGIATITVGGPRITPAEITVTATAGTLSVSGVVFTPPPVIAIGILEPPPAVTTRDILQRHLVYEAPKLVVAAPDRHRAYVIDTSHEIVTVDVPIRREVTVG